MSRSIFPISPRRARCVGATVQGAAALHATVSGSEDRPRVRIEASGDALGIGGSGAAQGRAQATVAWSAQAGRSGGAAADRGGRGVARPGSARGGAAQSRPRSSLVAVGRRQARFQSRRAGRFRRARRRDRYRRNRQDRGARRMRSTERCVWSSPNSARSRGLSGTRSAAG